MKYRRNFAKIRTVEQTKLDRSDSKFNGKYWKLWGIRLFGSQIDRVLKVVMQSVTKGSEKPVWIATVNTEFVVKALEDKEFFEILQKTDLNVMDGIGLVWAKHVIARSKATWQSRRDCFGVPRNDVFNGIKIGMEILRGKHREELVPGVELMERMCEEASKNTMSVYFFGGWGDRASRTADYMMTKYPGLVVAGFADEDFDFNTQADFLFVARGMKKQEEWIEGHFDKLSVKVVMGVGRSFDYFSGDLKRAPQVVRKMGFEWLYSLYKEPKRWRRQLALPKFIWKIIFG